MGKTTIATNPMTEDLQLPNNLFQKKIGNVEVHHKTIEDHRFYPDALPWSRLMATGIDIVIVMSIFVLVNLPLLHSFKYLYVTEQTTHKLVGALLFGIIYCVYGIWPSFASGQTFGKRVIGIRIVHQDLETPHPFGILFRETIGKALPILTLGLSTAFAGIREDKRHLHDVLCKTRVIRYRNLENFPQPF